MQIELDLQAWFLIGVNNCKSYTDVLQLSEQEVTRM